MAGTFSDKTRVAQAIGNHPGRVADLMEKHLTQQQITAFERLIVSSTNQQAVRELRAIRSRLKRLGRDGALSDVFTELDEVIAAVGS